jgi:hypothetical protein
MALRETATEAVTSTIFEYSRWITGNTGKSWVEISEDKINLADTWQGFTID